MNEALLLIDIGNTRTTLGLAARGSRGPVGRVAHIPTRPVSRADAIAAIRRVCGSRRPAGAVAASVVPGVNTVWSQAVQTVCGQPLHWIRHDFPWPFRLRYPRPETLGADRLANLCGALRRYRPPLVVLDFGTALTVDSLNAHSEFTGGTIAPGFGMLVDGLGKGTALLPVLGLRIGRMPANATGRSTRAAMRAGLLLGYRGLVRELIDAAIAPFEGAATLCVTGGYAAAIMAALPEIPCRIHPRLTLEGLAAAFELTAATTARSSIRRAK